MSPPIRQPSFAGGEIGPALYARTDLTRYENSLRTMRNYVAMRHGGAAQRPGTMYVGTALNGGAAVRLIPFIFNETGSGQSYMLEFGALYIAFYQNGANVISSAKTITAITNANPCAITSGTHGFSNGDKILITGVLGMINLNNAYFIVANVTANAFTLKDLAGNAIDSTAYGVYTSGGTASKIYIVTSPYIQGDLASLQFAESADVITICHPSYAPRELARVAATNWTLNTITFGAGLPPATALTSSGGGAGAIDYYYVVTATAPDGEESVGSVAYHAASIAALSPTNVLTLSWTGSNSNIGITGYRIYRGLTGASVGYIGTVPASTTSFPDFGITADYAHAPPQLNSIFGATDSYPSTVGFVQQRRVFANSNTNPLLVSMSKPGAFANFNYSLPTLDDDAIFFSIAGQEVNAVQHIVELKFMLILTAGAELFVQGNGSGTVTPSAINASTQSQYGSSSLQPIKIGDVCLFNQALGSFVRDFSFDFAIDGYRGNDITIFASHLFEGYQLVDWCFQKTPDSIVWAARSDGKLLGCTYVREQQILAWHRHDFTNGTVENVCAIPENGNYAVYLSIKRTINGSTVRYIERMSSRIWPSLNDPIDATYLDCYASYDGRNTGSTTMTLQTPVGGFKTDATAYQQQITLVSGAGYFTAADVGKQIVFTDATFTATQGKSGSQVQCTIQAYTNATTVTVTPSGVVPAEFQNTAVTTWSKAVKSLSGLTFLIGQHVSVWADRYVVGSPNNTKISSTYTVAADGTLTLDKPYSVIYVGLPMTADIETLDIETSFGETILAKRKRTAKLAVYLWNTRDIFAGSANPDNDPLNTTSDALYGLNELVEGASMQNYDQPPALFTGQDFIVLETRWNKNGRLFIRNVDPVPSTILSISPQGENPAPTPFYTRV